ERAGLRGYGLQEVTAVAQVPPPLLVQAGRVHGDGARVEERPQSALLLARVADRPGVAGESFGQLRKPARSVRDRHPAVLGTDESTQAVAVACHVGDALGHPAGILVPHDLRRV